MNVSGWVRQCDQNRSLAKSNPATSGLADYNSNLQPRAAATVTLAARDVPFRVTSVALFNRRLPVNFRYAPLATEIARRGNMSRWGPKHEIAAR